MDPAILALIMEGIKVSIKLLPLVTQEIGAITDIEALKKLPLDDFKQLPIDELQDKIQAIKDKYAEKERELLEK